MAKLLIINPEKKLRFYRTVHNGNLCHICIRLTVRLFHGCLIRDLSVHFDSSLLFSYHVGQMVCTTVRLMGMVTRITRHFVGQACLLRLFCSLIECRLEFGWIVWNSFNGRDEAQIE
ncbi:hypothetical protein IscW_ISCW010363 [Ixodes scapularis]|uniref:Uncharacterized protein n=1 Tax=Ixodes scapularis TaxID=6945 RepID=B7Q975_IXOSC|nr:hypothetical protein IscW_ISCW010363 [Ixodes scapularis]|eukprot:XP_002405646.1 hypothetical protein IscW_ISCW010363 [Ixodes scapularis]